MARKQILFVIVEGPSDETSLGIFLQRLFSNKVLHIEVVRGDITTKDGNKPDNIISKVCELVKRYAKTNKYTALHFAKIVHIVDTDGAYIPDDLIIENLELSEIEYSETCIQAKNRKDIEARNKQKRENLNKLSTTKQIWKLPYEIFYMSCNLDHVLHNKINSNDKEKEVDSYNFVKKYKDDLYGFVDYIDFCAKFEEYDKSWEYIKSKNNSLERNTNLNILLKESQAV